MLRSVSFMALIPCPDCGNDYSDQAAACPKCGRPTAVKATIIDKRGAWCPNCHNRNSDRTTQAGCFYYLLVVLTLGGALLFYPLLPRIWNCNVCLHKWRG